MGWFTPPFDTAKDVKQRLTPYYNILDFHVEGAMSISEPKRQVVVRCKASLNDKGQMKKDKKAHL